MSGASGGRGGGLGDGEATDAGGATGARWKGVRHPGMVGIALLTFSYVSVLYHVTDVVGGSATMAVVVAGSAVAAAALGRFMRIRTALFVGGALVIGGMGVYVLSVPASSRALFTVGRVVADTVALLTGLSVLRLTNAGVWALAIAPAPVFLSVCLALRGRYGWAVAVGGGALLFFILTGDADSATTLVGVIGAAAAVGFETMNVRGGVAAELDTLAVVVAAMIVLSAVLSVVPGGAAEPLLPDRGVGTVESNVVSSSEEVTVVGSIRLSPKVRFTVESDDPEYWQTGAYNRYTGSQWVRTDTARPYQGRLDGPPGESRPLVQTVTARTEMDALPAAWKPVAVDGRTADTAKVTRQGGLVAGDAVLANESYTVRSEVAQYTEEQLRRSGTDYPGTLGEDYTQLPDSTPDRVRDRAAEVAGDEENAYDKAVAIEEYLESNKGYTLNVEEPDGDVADEFLFEMDAGYCTYFATTMVVMLRAEGVPARFVTGYTPGERVGENEWVVRGLNAHAWVEVYFPDVGWVRFDPTPSDPRVSTESARLDQARQDGEPGVDTNETRRDDDSETPTPTPTETETPDPDETPTPDDGDDGTPNGSDGNASDGIDPNGTGGSDVRTPAFTPAPNDGGGGDPPADDGPSLPSRETLGVWLALLVGLVAGARRVDAAERAYRFFWLRHQRRRETPERDVERAYARLERLLEKRYRPRKPGETPRAYLRALSNVGLDPRAERVGRAYERARYGRGVTREEAETAIDDVDALVRSRGRDGARTGR
ncbi:transglutaminase TgpA family protein [Halegenticoccus soli]|uniref:transglutaminase TgpA family protein n=1 Tax=Halegenticoccus soli TaxID=1985678 RepID=UPI001E563B11|nr:DUF3488 and transglutaminase-like domain-containing protein [Halegenticoccus soli]